MKTGTLYLIPTPIDNNDLKDILLPRDISIVSGLRYFIVETPKNARKNLGTLLEDCILEIESRIKRTY
jgi:16S rRNA C1402 (ribose-2'-O) methylase RsmI